MINKVKVIICNKEYILQTEESPSYVYGLAKRLEKKLNDMCAGNSSVSPYSAAVMVALSTLDDLSKSQANFDNVRMQAKEYVDEAGKARIERDAALKQIQLLQNKVAQLEQQLQASKVDA
ncbi:MAG: cell division protein ZapA [Oscillospiraceae bacterium]|nr:cell division protein ZapA [Oscillospiraceae bacterium]